MSDLRVFASYDPEHDADLGERLVEQSRRGGSGFTVSDRSQPGEVTERWCELTRRRIRDADQVVVICGEHTEESASVNAELRIAQQEGRPCLMLWGRRERMCTMPARAARNACMYSWTGEVLLQQITAAARSPRPPSRSDARDPA